MKREKGFVDVRAAFVAQREAAEAMQSRQGAFDNPAEDAEAAAMRTAGLGGPWTLPAPWTPRARRPRLGNRCAISKCAHHPVFW